MLQVNEGLAHPYHVELIDGEEREKIVPRRLHALIQRFLLLQLSLFLSGSEYEVLGEQNVNTGARTKDGRREYVVPDLLVAPIDAPYEEGNLNAPPLLAVEIRSPGQDMADLELRASRLLALGCPVVWLIWPERRAAWEYRRDQQQQQTRRLSVLPTDWSLRWSLTIGLAEMWAQIEGK